MTVMVYQNNTDHVHRVEGVVWIEKDETYICYHFKSSSLPLGKESLDLFFDMDKLPQIDPLQSNYTWDSNGYDKFFVEDVERFEVS